MRLLKNEGSWTYGKQAGNGRTYGGSKTKEETGSDAALLLGAQKLERLWVDKGDPPTTFREDGLG